MSRLNSCFKLLSLNFYTILVFLGLGFFSYAVMVTSFSEYTLKEDYFGQARLICMVVIGIVLCTFPFIGCCGVIHQVQRGHGGGRQLLSMKQLGMVTVVIAQSIIILWLILQEDSLKEAKRTLPDVYDDAERRYRKIFNGYYFNAMECYSASWLWKLVDDCPSDSFMSSDQCECTDIDRPVCKPVINNVNQYSAATCCPYQTLCEEGGGTGGYVDTTCPYDRCRTPILLYMLDWISPLRLYLEIMLAAEVAIMLLTCVVICYNPKDTSEAMLTKCLGKKSNVNAMSELQDDGEEKTKLIGGISGSEIKLPAGLRVGPSNAVTKAAALAAVGGGGGKQTSFIGLGEDGEAGYEYADDDDGDGGAVYSDTVYSENNMQFVLHTTAAAAALRYDAEGKIDLPSTPMRQFMSPSSTPRDGTPREGTPRAGTPRASTTPDGGVEMKLTQSGRGAGGGGDKSLALKVNDMSAATATPPVSGRHSEPSRFSARMAGMEVGGHGTHKPARLSVGSPVSSDASSKKKSASPISHPHLVDEPVKRVYEFESP